MYSIGDVRGTVRNEPDGARLKVEARSGLIAAEWPIDRSIDGVIDLIEHLCSSPVSFASGDGESPWVDGIFPRLDGEAIRLTETHLPERMRLKGSDCLFVLRRRSSGSYALALRTRPSEWQTLAEPLIAATATDTRQRELSDMYQEITASSE